MKYIKAKQKKFKVSLTYIMELEGWAGKKNDKEKEIVKDCVRIQCNQLKEVSIVAVKGKFSDLKYKVEKI